MISDFELDIQERNIRTLGVLAFIEQAHKANALIRLIKENLKNNTIIHDDPRFKGRWVAIPEEAFDALRKETL